MTTMAEITDDDKVFIADYVLTGETRDERRKLRKECETKFDLTSGQVQAITNWSIIRMNRALKVGSPDVPPGEVLAPVDTPVISPPEEIVTHEQDIVVDTVEPEDVDIVVDPEELPPQVRGGEHVEYDNIIKQKWREAWKAFLEKHTDPAKRLFMKVLCLPGKKCLEIPLYLELGFRAENIVGVEGGDDAAWAEFEANAKRYGIRPFRGQLLDDFWCYTNERFDVLSYDFLGPSCKNYENTVAASLVNKDAVVMINVMKKRESRSAQYTLQGWSPFDQAQMDNMADETTEPIQRVLDLHRHMFDKFLNAYKGEGELSPLPDLRQNSLVNLYGQLLGLNRGENTLFKDDLKYLLSSGNSMTTQAGLGHVMECVHDAMSKLEGGNGYALNHTHALRGIASAAWQRIALATDIEQVQYKSFASGKACPFHTLMMKTHTPFADYYSMRHTLEFLITSARFYVDHPEEQGKMKAIIRDKKGYILPPGAKPHRRQQVYMRDSKGNSVASVEMNNLTNDTALYLDLAATDLKPKIMAGSYVPEVRVLE